MSAINGLLADNSPGSRSLRLKVMRPVYTREVVREGYPAYLARCIINTSQQVFELLHDLRFETKEHFLALHLDSKNRILCLDRISVGSLNCSVVHPREALKGALLSSAAAIVLAHNHPSGDATPSREDLELSTRLKECAELIGIRILDHVIIGDGCYVSLADRGLL